MKIIRTSNLTILFTAIMGGQIDSMGNHSESDHSFTIEYDHLRSEKNPRFCLEKIKSHIEFFIEEYGDTEFYYWGKYYKFKKPCTKNMHILTCRIWKEITSLHHEFLSSCDE